MKHPACDAIVKVVYLYSGNATLQFKNQDKMASIIPLEKNHDFKIFWDYFAALHRKGFVNGVGPAVKQMAGNKVRAEDAEMTSAEIFVISFQLSEKI